MTLNKPAYHELLLEIEELKKQLADKKALEKELAKAKILMKAAFDQSPVPLVVITYPDFTFKIINKATENFLLVSAEDYLGKTPVEAPWKWQEFYPDNTPVTDVHNLPLPMAIKGITTKNKEMYIVRHDKSIVWELASAAPIYDNEGQLLGAIYAATDITERKKTEQTLLERERKLKEQNEEYEAINEELSEANEQLQIAKNKAEESDRLKTAFLQNMSHEIRTPMNAIMGFSDLLVENFNDKLKLEKFSEIIRNRCDDLLNIINDILDISKIESGLLSINYENCDLRCLFNELHAFFEEQQKRMDKQEISLTFEPESNTNYTFKSDKVKVKQILINLISNAFKFTEKGSIKCGCRIEGEQLLFHVSDTGVGIPSDKHEFIFERFAQINQLPQKNTGGTGLGLSIVKGLVKLLGGKVWLESEPGKGTTFYFSIQYEKSAIEVSTTDSDIIEINTCNSNKTILIIEDDFYNSELLKEIFSKQGFNILSTRTGQDAIKIAINYSIDLILMDIRLTDITGYEVIRQIKQHKPNIKIIAQTAYAAIDEREKAIQNGCIDYISKPAKRDELLLLVNKHLLMNK
jgi:PAS domain S-box-containing protein